jgi:hypothetical protein
MKPSEGERLAHMAVWIEDVDASTGRTGRGWRLYRWQWPLPEFRFG